MLFGDGTVPYSKPENKPEEEKKTEDNASSKNLDGPPQQDDTKQRYSALAKVMRECGLGTDILKKIDF